MRVNLTHNEEGKIIFVNLLDVLISVVLQTSGKDVVKVVIQTLDDVNDGVNNGIYSYFQMVLRSARHVIGQMR